MTGPEQARTGLLAWAGVALVCLCAALAGLLEALLTPLYLGSHLVPIAVLGALVSNIAFPWLARNLVPTLTGTALPFGAWLVVLIGFGVMARPEGDVILPGGAVQLVSYGVLLGGALAGVATVVTLAPARPRAARLGPRPGSGGTSRP